MRKGQIKILEKAKSLKLNKEQISLLSREDFSINSLQRILAIFEAINDFPADKAYEHFQNGKNVFALYTHCKESLTYAQYLSITDEMQKDTLLLWKCTTYRKHIKDLNEPYFNTIKRILNSVNYIPSIEFIEEIVSDKQFKEDAWQIDYDKLIYYSIACNFLLELFKKHYKEEVMQTCLKQINITKILYEGDYFEEAARRISSGDLTENEWQNALIKKLQ